MSDLISQLADAEARVARLRLQIIQGRCDEVGHDWRHLGGMNAGCDRGNDCACSIPVHQCAKCGDCDYGDNDDAAITRDQCRREFT